MCVCVFDLLFVSLCTNMSASCYLCPTILGNLISIAVSGPICYIFNFQLSLSALCGSMGRDSYKEILWCCHRLWIKHRYLVESAAFNAKSVIWKFFFLNDNSKQCCAFESLMMMSGSFISWTLLFEDSSAPFGTENLLVYRWSTGMNIS